MTIYCTTPQIEGCEFERIDGEGIVAVGELVKCAACLGKFAGDAVLTVDAEGFTNVVSGRCTKYDACDPSYSVESISPAA